MKTTRIRQIISGAILLAALAMALSGCAPKIKLNVLAPAEIDTAKIKKVAVASFELATANIIFKKERNGRWKSITSKLNKEQKKALADQIRGGVINMLSATPYFKIVYTDEFQRLESDADLQKAISAGGFKTSEIDAVISGRAWLDAVYTDGVEPGKTELEFVQGRKGKFNYKVENLAFWPYKSVRGTLALELKLTALHPTEVISVTFDVKEYARKIGGREPDMKSKAAMLRQKLKSSPWTKTSSRQASTESSEMTTPTFEQIVADLSEFIGAKFIQRISVTQKQVFYPVADGNETAVALIKAGAYNKAIEVLTKRIDKKKPEDFYNLGLCYEAIGDYGIAMTYYSDALKREPRDLIYARGAGRIERKKRESHRLKRQLSSKQ